MKATSIILDGVLLLEPYNSFDEGGILWNDSAIGIDWNIESPIISERELNHPLLRELK